MKIKDINFNVHSEGHGEPLVWGHGLTFSMATEDAVELFDWDKFKQVTRLIRYDARGHGDSEPSYHSADYHWHQLADDLLLIADNSAVNKLIAGGQSMGSATALYAALSAPARVKGLILVNPPTAWQTRQAQSQFYLKQARIGALLGGKVLSGLLSRNITRLLPGWLVESEPEKYRGIISGLAKMQRRTLYNLFKGAAATDLPAKADIQTINIPTLILAWQGDPSHPVETATELNRLIAGSELHIAETAADVRQWPELIREFTAQINQPETESVSCE